MKLLQRYQANVVQKLRISFISKTHNQKEALEFALNLFYKSKTEVILDDEKCFCSYGDKIPSSARYFTNDNAQCSDDACFIGKDKYPKGHVKDIFSPI